MPLFARYDPTESPAQVIGWYDTSTFTYANLPADGMLPVTDAEWGARLANPSAWAVLNGVLVPYTPPAPPAPPPAPTMTPLTFMARFTDAETTAIHTAAMSNVALFGWLLSCAAATDIDLTDPRTKAGLDALVAAGLLTTEREAVILAP